ncbi:MAG TPA: hypothetical protein DF712_02875 [Balneola sp.]|nr:hypothetical protein [Balneola sp.]
MFVKERGTFKCLRATKSEAWKILSPDLLQRYGDQAPKQLLRGFFDVEYLLASAFHLNTKQAKSVKEWVAYTFNCLAYDGFVSNQNFQTAVSVRCAIAAFICDAPHYLDIVKRRFDPTLETRGANLGLNELTIDKLANPDYYISRSEVTAIKAIDLSLALLARYTDKSIDILCTSLGIPLECGLYTSEHKDQLINWVKERHHAQ